MFNENSGLVKIWIRLLKQENAQFTLEDVPDISNLRQTVKDLIDQKKGN